ncbi:hypothetical protein IP88_13940 [alpha proteobacterium AAP81b]|nr:hypothetical protein IP88_13940 [alpha proteobacterium AAP81b]
MDARRGGAVARQQISEPVGSGGDPVTTGLQRLFASFEDEPIPEDFLRLLDEIEARGAEVVDLAPAKPEQARDIS